MSFLDRFQNKISTVTASGQLKKAEGSDEIRVGPMKCKQAPNGSNQAGTSIIRGAGAAVVSNAGSLSARSTDLQYSESNSSYASPRSTFASPRNQGQPAASSNTYNNTKPNINREAYQFDKQELSHKEADRDQSLTPTTSKSSPSGRTNNPSTKEAAAAGSINSNSMKECRSPRQVNEARVRTDEDQLYFSRRGRPVQYEPCDLKQYKKEKPNGYFELGKLKPDLNSDELIQKRANAERIKAFSKNLREINKTTLPTATCPEKLEKENALPAVKSTREKAKEFAKTIPKPKAPKPVDEEANKPVTNASKLRQAGVRRGSERQYAEDEEEDQRPQYHAPGNEEEDEDEEVDAVTRELQELQARHAASKAQVEAIMRKA